MPTEMSLADVLVAAALEFLADEPAERLSLRRVAARVGVSHQGPYVHFGDKRRFLAAVAGVGLDRAGRSAADRVAAAGPDPVRRLDALVDAYLEFVSDQPHLHDLAYGPLVAMADHPDLQAAAIRYWDLLTETIAANQPPGVPRAEVLRRSAIAWGAVSGLARLAAAGKIPGTVAADRARLAHDAVRMLRRGWQAESGQESL